MFPVADRMPAPSLVTSCCVGAPLPLPLAPFRPLPPPFRSPVQERTGITRTWGAWTMATQTTVISRATATTTVRDVTTMRNAARRGTVPDPSDGGRVPLLCLVSLGVVAWRASMGGEDRKPSGGGGGGSPCCCIWGLHQQVFPTSSPQEWPFPSSPRCARLGGRTPSSGMAAAVPPLPSRARSLKTRWASAISYAAHSISCAGRLTPSPRSCLCLFSCHSCGGLCALCFSWVC